MRIYVPKLSHESLPVPNKRIMEHRTKGAATHGPALAAYIASVNKFRGPKIE